MRRAVKSPAFKGDGPFGMQVTGSFAIRAVPVERRAGAIASLGGAGDAPDLGSEE
jgi:hypothetical protein